MSREILEQILKMEKNEAVKYLHEIGADHADIEAFKRTGVYITLENIHDFSIDDLQIWFNARDKHFELLRKYHKRVG